jgi:hypothetical protein
LTPQESQWSAVLREFVQWIAGYPWQTILPVAAIALIALYLLLGQAERLARRRQRALPGKAVINGILLAVLFAMSILAVCNYTNFFRFRYNTYVNAYEFYHYYLGSKYAEEIGYTDLYNASVVADAEAGGRYGAKSQVRNLDTGKHWSTDNVLREKDRYRAKFSEARWEEWKKDIAWFKTKLSASRWNSVLKDKGYNSTPVWSMVVGGLLSNRIDTSNERGMLLLALLDPLLLIIGFCAVVWAFGLRTAMFLVVFLCTSYMSHFWHMKGAYLRTDFAMALVLSVCFLRKGWYGAAGTAAAWAVLSRVFPAVFLFGLGAKLLWDLFPTLRAAGQTLQRQLGPNVPGLLFAVAALHVVWLIFLVYGPPFLTLDSLTIWRLIFGATLPLAWAAVLLPAAVWGVRTKRLCGGHVRFFAALTLTTGLLVGASMLYWQGTGLWNDFISKIGGHNESISPWRVGFKYLYVAHWRDNFAFDLPFREMTPVINSATYRLNPVFVRSIMLFILIVSFFAVRHLKDWRALAFGFVPCFFLAAPTYYYYIMLLVPLLFLLPHLERPLHASGAALAFATAALGYWFYGMWRQEYATYYYLSCCVAGIVLLMIAIALARGRSWPHRLAVTLLTLAATAVLLWFYIYQMYPDHATSNTRAWMLLPVVAGYGVLMAALEWWLTREAETAASPPQGEPSTSAN